MRTNKKNYTELEKSVFVLGDFREREKNLLYLLWSLQVRAPFFWVLCLNLIFFMAPFILVDPTWFKCFSGCFS